MSDQTKDIYDAACAERDQEITRLRAQLGDCNLSKSDPHARCHCEPLLLQLAEVQRKVERLTQTHWDDVRWDDVRLIAEKNTLLETLEARCARLEDELRWAVEFVVEPEWFPNQGDRQAWQERLKNLAEGQHD